MKFKLPETCTGITFAGASLAVAKDGTVEVEPSAAASLAVHGILPVTVAPPGTVPPAIKRPDDKR